MSNDLATDRPNHPTTQTIEPPNHPNTPSADLVLVLVLPLRGCVFLVPLDAPPRRASPQSDAADDLPSDRRTSTNHPTNHITLQITQPPSHHAVPRALRRRLPLRATRRRSVAAIPGGRQTVAAYLGAPLADVMLPRSRQRPLPTRPSSSPHRRLGCSRQPWASVASSLTRPSACDRATVAIPKPNGTRGRKRRPDAPFAICAHFLRIARAANRGGSRPSPRIN